MQCFFLTLINYIYIYCLAISIFVQTISVAIASVTAARILHERLLDAIIKAPMSFFDTTPVGRVLNRFRYRVPFLSQSSWQSPRLVGINWTSCDFGCTAWKFWSRILVVNAIYSSMHFKITIWIRFIRNYRILSGTTRQNRKYWHQFLSFSFSVQIWQLWIQISDLQS